MSNKTLVSWYAYNHDFVIQQNGNSKRRLETVNEQGPTFNVHKYFGSEYSKHILLCSSDMPEEKKYFDLLVKELKKEFKKNILPRTIQLNDPTNIGSIFSGVSKLLDEFKNEQIEIFVNPGTPQMQMVWYLVQPNFKKNVRLFQMREAKFTATKEEPEKTYSDIGTIIFNPTSISNADKAVSKSSTENEPFIPDSIRPIYDKALRIARTSDVGCLILGENGTGKENLASYIHKHSDRNNKKFIAVNCAAFSDELLRSELFGYEEGAFTGADKQKTGIFEEANGGTIFLDEIGDISPKMQVSLLRAIQEKKIQKIGGLKDIEIDVRIITATNRDLEAECEKGNFRWDLFFRLAVATLILPPLRDWQTKDIKQLVEHFNEVYNECFTHLNGKLRFSKEVLDRLLTYHYKGNIRELQNLIIQLYTFCDDSEVEVSLSDLPERITKESISPTSLAESEKQHIIAIFEKNKKNISTTAKELEISRATLQRKLAEYGLRNQP